MQKKIRSALISVFYKDGLEPIVRELANSGAQIFSTGGTQKFIESLGINSIPVEDITSYPSILGGRVKTLHPKVFGAILGRRDVDQDLEDHERPHDAGDLDHARVAQKLPEVAPQGWRGWRLWCAQIDQQDAGAWGLPVCLPILGGWFFGYAHGAALSPLSANLHSSVVTATMSMGLVQ